MQLHISCVIIILEYIWEVFTIGILKIISNNLADFTQLEQIVAENIMETPYLAIECNITDLAEKLSVSRNTITRFCKKIGYHGYGEFVYAMEEELKKNTMTTPVEVTTTDYIASAYISALQKMNASFPEAECIRIAKKIMGANSIKIIATGKSYGAATHMCYRFQTVQKHMQVINHVDVFKDCSFLFEPEDLVLIFSQGGKSRYTNMMVEAAKRKTKDLVLFTMSQHVDMPGTDKVTLPSVANTKQLFANDNISIFLVAIEILLAYYIKERN